MILATIPIREHEGYPLDLYKRQTTDGPLHPRSVKISLQSKQTT